VLLLVIGLLFRVEAWVSPTASSLSFSSSLGSKTAATQSRSRTRPRTRTALFYSSEFGNNSTDATPMSSSSSPPPSVVERLRVKGVSVSPKGFHVLLESTTSGGHHGGSNIKSNRGDARSREQEISSTKEQRHQKLQKDEDKKAIHTSSSKKSNSKRKKKNSVDNSAKVNVNVLPLKMTNDPADAYAATSPESLTLCQLLSGVDMAGAILPPELLGRIVRCHIEDKLDSLYEDDEDNADENSVFTPVLSPIEIKIWEYLQNQEALLREQNLFGPPKTVPSSSFPPQIPMPQVTLDQLTLVPPPTPRESQQGSSSSSSSMWQCKLECALPEWKERIVVGVKADLLASLAYNYDPEASPLFTCIALALRYKAPIVLEQHRQQQYSAAEAPPPPTTAEAAQDNEADLQQEQNEEQEQQYYWSTRDDLDRNFPQRTTLEDLREQSKRVTHNIETGFEIHKLTGALQIAMRLGDAKAAEKIRAKLDEYDSMEDLPTTVQAAAAAKEHNDDVDTSDDPKRDDSLDDLENNILQ
jgi:hypothetical protein